MMGQRGSSPGICNYTNNTEKDPGASEHRSATSGGKHMPNITVPTECAGVVPLPIPFGEASMLRRSWLSVKESELAREWQVGRHNQSSGVLSTSPHVPLTCAGVPFPANRTSGVIHGDDTRELWGEGLPVGKSYFLALQSSWRSGGSQHRRFPLPPVNPLDLNESAIERAIEETVGQPLQPPVPLSFMVSDILVPQWEVNGLYDAPAVRRM